MKRVKAEGPIKHQINHTLQRHKIYNISNKTTLFFSFTYRKKGYDNTQKTLHWIYLISSFYFTILNSALLNEQF